MQLKPIAAIIVLSLVIASLLVAGCTTPPTVNQTTSPPNVTTNPAPQSDDLSTTLNNALKKYNYSIVVPFTRAVNQYGNWVYTAVAKDGEEKLVPEVHNITIEETKNRSDTVTRFDAYVAQAVSNGYKESFTGSSYWTGSKNVINRLNIAISEPNKGIYGHVITASVSSPSYYILTEYSTLVQITSNPNDATKFTHTSNKGYSITYPKEWDKDISTSAGVPVDIYLYPNPNNKADGVVVATYGLTAGTTQDAFVNYNVFELTNYSNHGVYKNFTILSQTSTTLSGKPANTIVWTGVIPVQYTATSYADTSMKVMQTYVINNNVGYVVTYKATPNDYNTYLAQAQQTINSFTVP